MSLYFSSIFIRGNEVEGWVANADAMETAIVARREPLTGKWEPLFGLKSKGGTRIELPLCFELEEKAVIALENAFIAEMEEPSSYTLPDQT